MNRAEFNIYCELYKRGDYGKIPIGIYIDGNYFYPTKKQIQTLTLLNDNTTTHVGYGGSARSGKSIIECVAIIFDCFLYPGIAWGLGRKELTILKKTVLITLLKQFSFYGIKSIEDYKYNQPLNKITFENTSNIFLIDTMYKPSEPLNTRFGGLELTRCAADESNETDITVINKLFERTGWCLNDKYKLKRKLFECFNPDKNHVYNRYYIPFRDKTEPLHRKFIPALPSDNPNPAVKEWIEDLITEGDIPTIERQINGNFEYDNNPNRLVKDYNSIVDLFKNHHIKGGTHYIICDAARFGKDKAIIIVFNGMIAVEKYVFDISKTTDISEKIIELQKKYYVSNTNTLVDADGVGGGVADEVGCVSFSNNAKPLKDNSSPDKKTLAKKPDFDNIKSQCAFKLADYINEAKLYIIFDCSEKEKQQIMHEFSLLKNQTDMNKRKLITKEEMKKYNMNKSPDWLDTFLMRMYFEIKQISEWAY